MGGLLVAAGCSSLKVNVIRDHAITIPPGSTWAWSPAPAEKKPDELDPRVNNSIIHDRVQRAVRPDCRVAPAGKGLFAVPFLLRDAMADDGCKW